MSTDSQQLIQLLNGRWAGILGDNACELHFGTIGLANPQFSGQIIIKNASIYHDKSNQGHQIIKLGEINLFEQFGNGYISFDICSRKVVAMLSKKYLTLKGHRTVNVSVRHQHQLISHTTSKNESHWHNIQENSTRYSYPSADVFEPFFAEKMN